jgi:hypothetical protein
MEYVDQLSEFLLKEIGKPTFALNVQNSDDSFQIQLWFYSPPSKLSEDNTVIYTVGLSRRYFEGPCPWIELSFQVEGHYDRPQLEKLGMIFGELIYDTCKMTQFTPNLLLTNLKRPFMPNMQDVLVVEGAGMRPLWLEMEDRTVRMLQLIPVYKEELHLIRKMGFWNTYRTFIENKINFFSPNRQKIEKQFFHPDDQRLVREVEIYKTESSKEEIWLNIKKWYQVNAPAIQAAQLETQPALSENWEMIFGLNKSFIVTKTDEWLVQHWQSLYSGRFLPTPEKFLPINPHFLPN